MRRFPEPNISVHLMDEASMESFRTDTLYFTEMGDDKVRVRFFKAFVEHIRRCIQNSERRAASILHPCPLTVA